MSKITTNKNLYYYIFLSNTYIINSSTKKVIDFKISKLKKIYNLLCMHNISFVSLKLL